MFYHGQGQGRVRSVVRIRNMDLQQIESSNYLLEPVDGRGESAAVWLDDPFEGELMVLFMHLLGDWSDYSDPAMEKRLIWQRKQHKLVQVDYVVNTSFSIAVQQGFWYSAHEQWKLLALPYMQSPIVAKVFENVERARLYDASSREIPGLYASVGEPEQSSGLALGSSPSPSTCKGYCSAVGVQDVAVNGIITDRVITPYGAYPSMLVDRGIGLAWHKVMLSAPRMQSEYGSVESTTTDGHHIAPLLTWDAKVTNVLAMLGGMANIAEEFMKAEGVYDDFMSLIEGAYRIEFPEADAKAGGLKGSTMPFARPSAEVPNAHPDFPSCTRLQF